MDYSGRISKHGNAMRRNLLFEVANSLLTVVRRGRKLTSHKKACVALAHKLAERRWIIGTPDDAIEAIQALIDETGGFGGLMIATHEWASQQKIDYSLELFARFVMPHFRGHSADLRRAWERTRSDRLDGRIPSPGGMPDDMPSVADHQSNTFVKR